MLARVGIVRTRSAFALVCGHVGDNLFFYNNSLSVTLRALTERLYYVKGPGGFVPCPRPTVGFDTLAGFARRVRNSMPGLPPVWTYDEFVQSYTGSKRKRYEVAAANLAMRGLRRSDGYLRTFIKAEFYDGSAKEDPCPRLIQPRTPEYNVAVGVFLRPLEKMVYKAIDRVFKHHVVLKCDNAWTRARTIVEAWGQFKNPCFVGLDASRFDQHVSVEALEFEHDFYCSNFPKDVELAELLKAQRHQTGFANVSDGTIKYKVDGCRASGDMNTALGNVFLMCAISHHFLSELPCKWRFINDGDDCGVFIEREHLHLLDALPAHHLQYGFEMTVEPAVYNLEQVEFCQSRPVQLNQSEWMMVRNIHKCMRNDLYSITSRNYASFEETLVATGRCGLSLYEGVPVLDALYRSMLRFEHREHVVQRILTEEFSGLGRTWRMFASAKRPYEVDETVARVSVYKAFGLLPDEQIAHEQRFRAIDPQAFVDTVTFQHSTDRVCYFPEQHGQTA